MVLFSPRFHLDGSNFDIALSKALYNETVSNSQFDFYRSIKSMMMSWFERGMSIFLNGTEYEFLKCNKTILVDTVPELELLHAKMVKEQVRSYPTKEST